MMLLERIVSLVQILIYRNAANLLVQVLTNKSVAAWKLPVAANRMNCVESIEIYYASAVLARQQNIGKAMSPVNISSRKGVPSVNRLCKRFV